MNHSMYSSDRTTHLKIVALLHSNRSARLPAHRRLIGGKALSFLAIKPLLLIACCLGVISGYFALLLLNFCSLLRLDIWISP